MFKSAATKLAHNSTLPALAGNKDIRPLQDLITAEKAVLNSLQRLSIDLDKSSDCLRSWGSGEGDDLQDILTASRTLLGYVAAAFSQLATHESSIREHMKSVRTQEENLDEVRKRRKAVSAKAEAAEKRLSKMSPEHKSLQQQTELLNNLREQIRSLDWEILTGEAKLGDFKRTQTKNWMTLKFGGLLECAEKATIVGEMGKLIIEEIPLNPTDPGQARTFYNGHEKVEKIVGEAQRCVSEIIFDPQPIASTASAMAPAMETMSSTIDGLPSSPTQDSSAYLQDTSYGGPGFGPGMNADEFGGLNDRGDPRGYGTMPMPSGPVRISEDGSRIASSTFDGNASRGPSSPAPSRVGMGGQFSTFPTRKASLGPPTPAPAPVPPPSNMAFQSFGEGSSSFASDVADALAYAEREPEAAPKTSQDGRAPTYEPRTWTAPSLTESGLPRGAAPPAERNPWDSVPTNGSPEYPVPGASSSVGPNPHEQRLNTPPDVIENESELPYASPPPAFSALPPTIHGPEDQQHATGHLQGESSPLTRHEPEPSEEDEAALTAAAAREVAREMDALTFRPPPGPPHGHIENRTPSPLLPPAPPFAQQQPVTAPTYGGNLSARPESGMYGARPDMRGSSQTLNLDTTTSSQHSGAINAPYTPTASYTYSTRSPASASVPANINIQMPSPATSFISPAPSVYATPPEMPAAQPMRTGSPVMLSPGTRTISAAAFKRPQNRSPSGGVMPDAGRPLPDVTPLSLRKRSGAMPSPSANAHAHAREPASTDEQQQQQQTRRSNDSARQGDDDGYDIVSSYGADKSRDSQEEPGSPGYGRGKFATNLEKDSRL